MTLAITYANMAIQSPQSSIVYKKHLVFMSHALKKHHRYVFAGLPIVGKQSDLVHDFCCVLAGDIRLGVGISLVLWRKGPLVAVCCTGLELPPNQGCIYPTYKYHIACNLHSTP